MKRKDEPIYTITPRQWLIFTVILTGTSVSSTAASNLISLNCAFIMDWNYLGGSPTVAYRGVSNCSTIQCVYLKQKDLVENVAKSLYSNPSLQFQALEGQIGYTANFNSPLDTTFYSNYSDFLTRYQGDIPEWPLNYCPDTVEELNDNYNPDANCVVFFYGSNTVPNCTIAFDASPYKKQIAILIDGVTINPISSPTVPAVSITRDFTSDDENAIVDAILNAALPSTTSSKTRATTSTTMASRTTESITKSLNCAFIMDWNYLGNPTGFYSDVSGCNNIQCAYLKQKTLAENVAKSLYSNPSLQFQALEGQIGYLAYFNSPLDTVLYSTYGDFMNRYQGNFPEWPLDYCPDTIEELNDSYNSDANCVVFFYGSNTVPNCTPAFDSSPYEKQIAVVIGGATIRNPIMSSSASVVRITKNFTASDTNAVLAAILKAALS